MQSIFVHIGQHRYIRQYQYIYDEHVYADNYSVFQHIILSIILCTKWKVLVDAVK